MDQNTLTAIAIVAGILILFRLWNRMQRSDNQSVVAALAEGAVVIDVRSPSEFSSGHYPGAVNIPLDLIGSSVEAVGVEHHHPVVVYCASGMRSASARRILQAAGFTRVVNAGSLGNLPAPKRV
ncbi:MAG: rhodanese-like domain-containing protein [Formivibrio sp.]|nr:rhodanese-like domain-containing protein [Formivibrio sp.]